MTQQSVTRGGSKDLRGLVKELRGHGLRCVPEGRSLVIMNEQGVAVGELPLRCHDHRTLKNVRAELRRRGLLPREEHRRVARPERLKPSSDDHRQQQPSSKPKTTRSGDQFDWLRRPHDPEWSAALRLRLIAAFSAYGEGNSAKARRAFASAALRYAERHDLRSFSGPEPQRAAEMALRHLLIREGGALSIWTLRLFGRLCEELEAKQRAA